MVDVSSVPVPFEHHAAAGPFLGDVKGVVAIEDDIGQRPVHNLRGNSHLVHRHRASA